MYDLKANVVELLDKFLPICEMLVEISTQVDKSSDYWAREAAIDDTEIKRTYFDADRS